MKKISTTLLMIGIIFSFLVFIGSRNALATGLVGNFDGIDESDWTLKGWVYNSDTPDTPIEIYVQVEDNGYILGNYSANIFRPDVNATLNIAGNHGFAVTIPEYLRNQFHTFYVYTLDKNNQTPIQIGFPKTIGDPPNPNYSISGEFDGSTIVISSSTRNAGAIDSVIWKGKEFINAWDHGRELQSASQLDGEGENYNPTEAGSLDDAVGPTSSSVPNYISTTENSVTTIISPAYWKSPEIHQEAVNTTIVSEYLIKKIVTIGYKNLPNIIIYTTDYFMPRPHQFAVFEFVTGYMTNEFTSYWKYDPTTNNLAAFTPSSQGEQNLPLIFSTPDQKYAMGIYCPGLPQEPWPDAGYGQFNFSGDPIIGTNKWNCVHRVAYPSNSHYIYTGYIAVGTLSSVKSSLHALYLDLNFLSVTPTEAPIQITSPVIIPGVDVCMDIFKGRGDADRSLTTDINDASIWRSEFIEGEYGTVSRDWKASNH
ncbi:hypothetical protein KKD03_04985, partial [Patescibacteria group bacterium]|nr:hypothetical protein [Patescibacteria group bacterium]